MVISPVSGSTVSAVDWSSASVAASFRRCADCVSKLWRFRYRFAGRANMLTLGAFPTVSLATARQKREEARRQLADGSDPAVKRKLDKIAAATAARNTFGAVAAEYLANMAANGVVERTISKNRWLLEDLAAPLAEPFVLIYDEERSYRPVLLRHHKDYAATYEAEDKDRGGAIGQPVSGDFQA